VKVHQKLCIVRNDSTNSDWIANWGMGGGGASRTASFWYISYCDTIRTQILNWSLSLEFANLWNRPKNRGFGAIRFCDRVILMATVPRHFQPGPEIEPPIWNCC